VDTVNRDHLSFEETARHPHIHVYKSIKYIERRIESSPKSNSACTSLTDCKIFCSTCPHSWNIFPFILTTFLAWAAGNCCPDTLISYSEYVWGHSLTRSGRVYYKYAWQKTFIVTKKVNINVIKYWGSWQSIKFNKIMLRDNVTWRSSKTASRLTN